MTREYPDLPVVGVGGVLIEDGRTLLIKRGTEPLLGQWSIPGGTLELGESLQAGVAREMLEETGLEVKVLDMIEAFDRIFTDPAAVDTGGKSHPKYHFVILDYLCERLSGSAQAGSDVTDVAFASEAELENFHLTSTAMRVLRRAFAMDRERRKSSSGIR